MSYTEQLREVGKKITEGFIPTKRTVLRFGLTLPMVLAGLACDNNQTVVTTRILNFACSQPHGPQDGAHEMFSRHLDMTLDLSKVQTGTVRLAFTEGNGNESSIPIPPESWPKPKYHIDPVTAAGLKIRVLDISGGDNANASVLDSTVISGRECLPVKDPVKPRTT